MSIKACAISWDWKSTKCKGSTPFHPTEGAGLALWGTEETSAFHLQAAWGLVVLSGHVFCCDVQTPGVLFIKGQSLRLAKVRRDVKPATSKRKGEMM